MMKVKIPEGIALFLLALVAFWIFVVLPFLYRPASPDGIFWGWDNTAWTAIGALAGVVYCALTAGLLFFAMYQVSVVRADARITRTLAACDRYDTDPILDQVTRRISFAYDSGDLETNPTAYKVDLYSLFNYFESIAIGVSRGLYDESIVRDQLEEIIVDYVDDLIVSGITGWAKIPAGRTQDEYFNHMMKLYRKWKAGCGRPSLPAWVA